MLFSRNQIGNFDTWIRVIYQEKQQTVVWLDKDLVLIINLIWFFRLL